MKKLWEIIKELEDREAITDYYLHKQCYSGEFELNIEFNNIVADKILDNNNIKEMQQCAFWE